MVSSRINCEDTLIDEDMDVSHEKHRQLLQTITSKTKRKYVIFIILYMKIHVPISIKIHYFCFRIQPSVRNEPSLQVSEFHLSSGQQTTSVNDLTNALKKKAPQLRQKIQAAKSNKKLLKKPLDRVYAEKVIFFYYF